MKSLFIVLSCLLFLSSCSNLKGVIGIPQPQLQIQPQYYYQQPQTQPTYGYYPYVQPTLTSSATSNNLAGNTNTVSQNLPQGGSQSTSTSAYGQNYYTGTYPSGSVPYSVGSQAQVMLPTQTYAPVDTSKTDLLAALSIASQQQNAALAQAANANMLNQMFGTTSGINGITGIKNGITTSGSGATMTNNMATTNNQNVGVNTSASQGSNANTNLNNNAISSGNNGITAGYTTSNQGTVVAIKPSPYM